MISSVKRAVAEKLENMFPDNIYTVYDEYLPQDFSKPSFLITLTKQDYKKILNNKYKSLLSFDISYFSDKSESKIKNDCIDVQLDLLRQFDSAGLFKIINKKAEIKDNVLHFTFDLSYCEIKKEIYSKMEEQKTNTNLKE